MARLLKIQPPHPPNQSYAIPTPLPCPLPLGHPLPVSKLPDTHLEEHHAHGLRVAMLVMACVVGVLMFLCTFFLVFKRFYSRRHNQNRSDSPILFDFSADPSVSDDENEREADIHPIWFIRTVGLQQSFIDSITVFNYQKHEGLIDGTECSVCLGEFEENESLRLLPKCSHAFHIPCIDTWLRSHKNCPLCRAPLFHDGTTQISGSPTDQNSNFSDHTQNQEAQTENSDGGVGLESNQVGESVVFDGDDGSVTCSSGVRVIDTTLPNSLEDEIQPLRRSVSMDSSSALVILDMNSEKESSESEARLGEKVNSSSKDMMVVVAKPGIGCSSSSSCSTIQKLASIGRVLQKRPVSMRSFSHNRKFLFSRHCRSQSSTLPV